MSERDHYILMGLLVTIIGFFIRAEWLDWRRVKKKVLEKKDDCNTRND